MLRIGQKFFTSMGTFEIKEHLGQGKTAEVYLGINTRTVEAVAIKIAREGMGERVKQNFLREEEVLTRLQAESPDSGHFPRVLCSGEKGEQPYLVMTLVKANSLWDMALENSSRLSGSLELERLAIDAAASYAHMLMILHHAGFAATDRKLDDVLWLADEQKVIVLDWNAIGSGEIGQRNDLYQFGVFWHQLLLGTVPPRGGQSLSGHRYWSELSYGTQQILVQALHPQPDARFKMAEALLMVVEEQQKRLYMPLEVVVSQAATRREKQAGEAYALLDIAIKFYPDRYASADYSAWKELGQKITGTGQNLINQGSNSFQQGNFDLARGDFLEALKAIGDDVHKQLHIHRWLVLLEAMVGQSKFVLPAAALLVQAMNDGHWHEAEQGFAYLESDIKSPLPEGILNLQRDFQMIQNVNLALTDIEQRQYQAASDKYQMAYKSRQALPSDYRTKLMKAGWHNLDLYANACKQLAETEGKAIDLLAAAQVALDKNDLTGAKDLLESGYKLILSRQAREGRERLVDAVLPARLEDQFIRVFRSLSYHQQITLAASWPKQLPILRTLRDEFPDETWADNQLRQMRQSLLEELAHHSDWRTADEWVVATKEEPFSSDPQVQEALAAFLPQISQRMVAEMSRHGEAVQELLKVGPTDNLLIAAAKRLDMLGTSLQKVQELTPLIFTPDQYEKQSAALNPLRQQLQQSQDAWENLKAKAKRLGIIFDAHGDDLPEPEKNRIELLVERNQQVIQQEVDRVNQYKQTTAQKLFERAKNALEGNDYFSARDFLTQLRGNSLFLEADRHQATVELQKLERDAAAYNEAKTKVTLLYEQLDATSITPLAVEAETGKIQEIITVANHLSHPAIKSERETFIALAEQRLQTIRGVKATELLAIAYQLEEQTPLLPENTTEAIQALTQAIRMAEKATQWDSEREPESKQLVARLQKQIETIGTNQRKAEARECLKQARQKEERVSHHPEDVNAALQILHQAIMLAQQAPHFDDQCQKETDQLVEQIQQHISQITAWVEQQEKEAKDQKQAQIEEDKENARKQQVEIASQQLDNADILLQTINTYSDDPDAVIKQLENIRLSIQLVEAKLGGAKPGEDEQRVLVEQANRLDERAQDLINQIRQYKIDRKLQAARELVASLQKTTASRLQEVNLQVEALLHTVLLEWPERQAEVEKLKQSLLQISQEIAQYERQKQIEALRQQIEQVSWPEAGETGTLLQTMHTAMPLANRCQQLLEFSVAAQTEPMTAQVKELLAHAQRTIKTAWEQEVDWFRVQVNQLVKVDAEFPITSLPGSIDNNETAITMPSLSAPVSALEKKLNTLRRVADIVTTDAALSLPLEQLQQVIQSLRNELWLRQIEQFDALAIQAIAQQKYHDATLLMDNARGLQELLLPTAQTTTRQSPDERLLEVARRSAKEEKFALVLQISTFLRGYYQHLEQRGLALPQLAEATQLETDALAHIIGDQRRQEIAKQYRQEAVTLWHGLHERTQVPGGSNPLTNSDDYHRALDFWGWAVVFDPEILDTKDDQEKKIVQAWQERHDNRLRARFLCQRSRTSALSSLRERFTWLKEAHYLARELTEVQAEYQVIVSEVQAKVVELRDLKQKVQTHLNDGQYNPAEKQCHLIEEQLGQLPATAELKDDQTLADALAAVQEAEEQISQTKKVIAIDQLREEKDLAGLLGALRAISFSVPPRLKKDLLFMVTHHPTPKQYRSAEVKYDLKRMFLKHYVDQLATQTV